MSAATSIALIASAAAAAVGTGYSIYAGQKQADAQKDAANKAEKAAAAQADQADQANNRANARSPDVAAMLGANQRAAREGASGTMLTGPTGVDTSQLSLGKSTLLGG